MRSAVVYYSLEGNTRAAATQLAQRLEADLFEIRTLKPYPRRGLRKFLVGGKDATFGRLPQIESIDMEPSDYDLVVLAYPVWAGKPAAPINSFLAEHDCGAARMALVVASASGDAGSSVKALAQRLGRASEELETLSLTNPGKLPFDELGSKVDSFAARLAQA